MTINFANRSAIAFVLATMTTTANATTLTSSKGYRFTQPTGWTVSATKIMGADMFLYLPPVDHFAPNINVVVVKSKPGENLAASGKELNSAFAQQFSNYHSRFQHVVKVGGHNALETEATYTRGTNNDQMVIHQFCIVAGKSDYVVTLTGDVAGQSKYEVGLAEVMRTLKIAHR